MSSQDRPENDCEREGCSCLRLARRVLVSLGDCERLPARVRVLTAWLARVRADRDEEDSGAVPSYTKRPKERPTGTSAFVRETAGPLPSAHVYLLPNYRALPAAVTAVACLPACSCKPDRSRLRGITSSLLLSKGSLRAPAGGQHRRLGAVPTGLA